MKRGKLFWLAIIALLLMGMNIAKWLFTAYCIAVAGTGGLILVEPAWVYLAEFLFVVAMMLIIIAFLVKKL
ncbi:MAG: hypothetical protein ACXADB_10995 [Candidatus Hermodarchaeia archaeon]